DTGIYYCTGYY
nr:immunoglobulin heavy chain junction region [Mus musculus]